MFDRIEVIVGIALIMALITLGIVAYFWTGPEGLVMYLLGVALSAIFTS